MKQEQTSLSYNAFTEIVAKYSEKKLKNIKFESGTYDTVIFEFPDAANLRVNYNAGSLVAIVSNIDNQKSLLAAEGKDTSEKRLDLCASIKAKKEDKIYSGTEYEGIPTTILSQESLTELVTKINAAFGSTIASIKKRK